MLATSRLLFPRLILLTLALTCQSCFPEDASDPYGEPGQTSRYAERPPERFAMQSSMGGQWQGESPIGDRRKFKDYIMGQMKKQMQQKLDQQWARKRLKQIG